MWKGQKARNSAHPSGLTWASGWNRGRIGTGGKRYAEWNRLGSSVVWLIVILGLVLQDSSKSPYCLRGQPDSHERTAQVWQVSSPQPDQPTKLCLFCILMWQQDSVQAETGDSQAPLEVPEMQTEAGLSYSHLCVSVLKAGRTPLHQWSPDRHSQVFTLPKLRSRIHSLKRKETDMNWEQGCKVFTLLLVRACRTRVQNQCFLLSTRV